MYAYLFSIIQIMYIPFPQIILSAAVLIIIQKMMVEIVFPFYFHVKIFFFFLSLSEINPAACEQ